MDLTDIANRLHLNRMLGSLGGSVFWNPYSPSSSSAANSNVSQYPSQATMLRNALNQHLSIVNELQNNLASSTDPTLSSQLRARLASASADAQAVRARLQALTTPQEAVAGPRPPMAQWSPSPQEGTTINSLPRPLMSPSLVTRPGSGGLFNEEEYLQHQRENQPE